MVLKVWGKKASKPVTAVWDCVSTFLRVTPLVFLTRPWNISSCVCGDRTVSTVRSQHNIKKRGHKDKLSFKSSLGSFRQLAGRRLKHSLWKRCLSHLERSWSRSFWSAHAERWGRSGGRSLVRCSWPSSPAAGSVLRTAPCWGSPASSWWGFLTGEREPALFTWMQRSSMNQSQWTTTEGLFFCFFLSCNIHSSITDYWVFSVHIRCLSLFSSWVVI